MTLFASHTQKLQIKVSEILHSWIFENAASDRLRKEWLGGKCSWSSSSHCTWGVRWCLFWACSDRCTCVRESTELYHRFIQTWFTICVTRVGSVCIDAFNLNKFRVHFLKKCKFTGFESNKQTFCHIFLFIIFCVGVLKLTQKVQTVEADQQ